MTGAEKAWREVRRATSFTQVISRSQTWFEEIWPNARSLGHTRRSTATHPVPILEVDDFRGRHTAGYWVDDMIIVPPRKTIKAILDRYTLGASPTLDWTMAIQTVPEYTRSIILHEAQHGFDWVDSGASCKHVKWISSYAHDKRFWNRITKLEAIYCPLGL